jgi:hypothetical protein
MHYWHDIEELHVLSPSFKWYRRGHPSQKGSLASDCMIHDAECQVKHRHVGIRLRYIDCSQVAASLTRNSDCAMLLAETYDNVSYHRKELIMMLRVPFCTRALFIVALHAGLVSGQPYPNKPVRVLTSAPGGFNDIAVRLITQGLTELLGQQVVVDNRGGYVSTEIVTRSVPDGYNILFTGTSFWTTPRA